MFRTVSTLIRASVAEADEELTERTATTLLAQHLRDAKTELAARKAGLAHLMAREAREARSLEAMAEMLTRRETEAQTALNAGDEELAEAIADDMLRLEDEIAAAKAAARRLAHDIAKARTAQDIAERAFGQLSDQLRAARATGPAAIPPDTALKRAAAVAETLKSREAQAADLAEAYERMEKDASAQSLDAKLAASGLFDDKAERRADLLKRIKKFNKGEKK